MTDTAELAARLREDADHLAGLVTPQRSIADRVREAATALESIGGVDEKGLREEMAGALREALAFLGEYSIPKHPRAVVSLTVQAALAKYEAALSARPNTGAGVVITDEMVGRASAAIYEAACTKYVSVSGGNVRDQPGLDYDGLARAALQASLTQDTAKAGG